MGSENRGRAAIEFDLEKVKEYGKLSCTQAEIAYMFGVSRKTIERRFQKDDEFVAAYEDGRQDWKISLRRMMHDKCLKGDGNMMRFLSKQDLGMSDNVKTELNVGEDFKPILELVMHGKVEPPVNGSTEKG